MYINVLDTLKLKMIDFTHYNSVIHEESLCNS